MKKLLLIPLVLGFVLVGASFVNAEGEWYQGFETDTSGWLDSDDAWSGDVARVPSGDNGITSSEGDFHAIMTQTNTGPFSRFDGYRDEWPGDWTAEIDVYLDPAALEAGEGFDYSVAANGSDNAHQRDYIFHVTKDTSTGDLLVGGSNNTNFDPREDLENINHYEIVNAGWYTLQHHFYDDGGSLSVDLNLLDDGGTTLFTETRSNVADTIPAEVGGNRYAWFTNIDVEGGIAVDAHHLDLPAQEGDICPGTTANDEAGSDKLNPNRWHLEDEEWTQGQNRGKKGSNDKTFDLESTYGCSCDQILEWVEDVTGEDFGGHWKFGCSQSILEDFIRDYEDEEIDGVYHVDTFEVNPHNDVAEYPDPVTPDEELLAGEDYTLVASGVWSRVGGNMFDAQYSSKNPDFIWGENGDVMNGDLRVNDDIDNTNWGPLDEVTHTYEMMYSPLVNELTEFYVWMNDVTKYPNNLDEPLTVDIFQNLY